MPHVRDEENGSTALHDRRLAQAEELLLAHEQPGGSGSAEELVPGDENGIFSRQSLKRRMTSSIRERMRVTFVKLLQTGWARKGTILCLRPFRAAHVRDGGRQS